MNGIHDMGGMQGLGELEYLETEPVFEEPWEGRMYSMLRSLGVMGGFRIQIESIPAEEYLRMRYYERWLHALERQLIRYDVVSEEELESGVPDPGSAKGTVTLTVDAAHEFPFRTPQEELDLDLPAQFSVGDAVRVRNVHPTTHTRMPRYTRGKAGVVERVRGIFGLPDTEDYGHDPKPQHVYLIRFSAQELWGEEARPQDSLYIDMWEDYLEPV